LSGVSARVLGVLKGYFEDVFCQAQLSSGVQSVKSAFLSATMPVCRFYGVRSLLNISLLEVSAQVEQPPFEPDTVVLNRN
jgi:hypothetical protein